MNLKSLSVLKNVDVQVAVVDKSPKGDLFTVQSTLIRFNPSLSDGKNGTQFTKRVQAYATGKTLEKAQDASLEKALEFLGEE